MLHSTALVVTDRPERYIKQLVSHMSHKVDTELAEDGRGTITLNDGSCVLTVSGGQLKMVSSAADDEALAKVQDVITRHLIRFASKEELVVDWTAPVTG